MKSRIIMLAALSLLPAPAHAACAFADRLIGDPDYAVTRLVQDAGFIGFVRRGPDVFDGTGTRQTLDVLMSLKDTAQTRIVLPAYIDSSGAVLAGSSVQDTRLEIGDIGFVALYFNGTTFQRSECLDIALSGTNVDERIRRISALLTSVRPEPTHL